MGPTLIPVCIWVAGVDRYTVSFILLTIGSAASLSFCVNTAPPLSGKSANPEDTQPKGHELMLASGPSIMYGATAPGPQATVYYYQDPRTGQRIASLLPPDHPQMVCLQAGEHVPETRYGFLGALCFHALLFVDYVWAHVYVLRITRRSGGDCVVPSWYRSVSARSPRPMQTLRRVN